MDDTNTVTLKFRVDTDGVAAGAATTAAAVQRVVGAATAGQKGFADLAKSTALTRQEMLALNYTVSDVVASLASGTSPFTILLQQGGQVRDSFGGFGNLFSKLAAQVSLARLAFGGGAIAVGVLGTAVVKGMQQSIDFEKAVQRTGNAAGLTAGQFNAMASAVQQSSGGTIGAAREILQGLVATGQVGAPALQAVASAATAMAKATGQSEQEIVKDFAGMSGGVARWAIEHNRSMNYINADQVRYIRNLEAQGKVAEAQILNAALLQKAAERVNANLGSLEKTWNSLKNAASSAWDAMLGIGRAGTTVDALAKLREQLALLEDRNQRDQSRGNAGEVARRAPLLENLRQQIDALREKDQLERRSAGAQAAQAAKNAKDIEAGSKAGVDAQIALDRAKLGKLSASAEFFRTAERQAVDRQFELNEIGYSAYVERVVALDRQAFAAKESAIRAEAELEKRRVTETPQDEINRKAKLLDLDTKTLQVANERLRYEEKVQRGTAVDGAPKSDLQTANQQFRQFEAQQRAATEEGLRQRSLASDEVARQLVQRNQEANIMLIADDRQRGLAVIALDEKTLRDRLDLETLSARERQQVEEDLATWRVLRERELTEQLKPEYQRQLELFADTARYMRQASDQFHQGFIDSGRDAFTTWATTGKLSAASLTQFIQQSFAKIAYDKYLAGGVNDIASFILRGFTGGGSSSAPIGDSPMYGGGGYIGGGAARGGMVSPGSLVEVNERGTELLSVRGRDYLMMGSSAGIVTPAGQFGSAPAAGSGGIDVQVINAGQPVTARAEQSRGSDGRLMLKLFLDAAAQDIRSGGALAGALQGRGVNLSGALPRRG